MTSIIKVPNFLANLTDRLLGRLLKSPAPDNLLQPMGATLELQRQQQVERMEQQVALAQARSWNRGFNIGRPQPIVSIRIPQQIFKENEE